MKGLNETKRASMHLLGFIDHEKAKGASLREISRTSNPGFHLSTWLGYIIWPLFAAGSCSLPFNKQDVENESNDSTTETIVTSTKGRIVFSKNAQKKRVVAKKQASHRLHGFTLLEVRSMTLFANDCYSATAEDWRQIQIITILRKRSSSC